MVKTKEKPEMIAYNEAKKVLKNLGINSMTKFNEFRKRKDFSNYNIPYDPKKHYGDEFESMTEFLSSSFIVDESKYVSFEAAKAYARTLKCRTFQDWENYCSMGKINHTVIPKHVDIHYKEEFTTWDDFLGINIVASKVNGFVSYAEARKILKDLKKEIALELNTVTDWNTLCAMKLRPKSIPANPSVYYKELGWKSFAHFLSSDKYWDFMTAKNYLRDKNLTCFTDWEEYKKLGKKPATIPSEPHLFYDEWKGYEHFFSTGDEQKKLTFLENKAEIRKMGFTTPNQYAAYRKMNPTMPAKPQFEYKNLGWVSWEDFFGVTSDLYCTYDECKEYVKQFNLRNSVEWDEFVTNNVLPDNIPYNPKATYKNSGWIDWKDFLNRNFVPYSEALSYVESLNLKSSGEWDKMCENNTKRSDVPRELKYYPEWKGWVNFFNKAVPPTTLPEYNDLLTFARGLNLTSRNAWENWVRNNKDSVYAIFNPENKYAEFKSWEDFIGYKKVLFITFDEVVAFFKANNIGSYTQWENFCKSGKRPSNIPREIKGYYADKGYNADILYVKDNNIKVTKNTNTSNVDDVIFYPSFEDLKEYVLSLEIKSVDEWRHLVNTNQLPIFVPSSPEEVYPNEWVSYNDFLGLSDYLSYDDAKEFLKDLNINTHSEWVKYVKSGNKPFNIPNEPHNFYKDKGWVNSADFFSVKKYMLV